MILIVCVPAGSVHAGDSSRAKKRFGFVGSLNGEPAPSSFGGNFAINLKDYVRLDVGGGYYTDWFSQNAWRLFFDLSLRPVMFMVAFIFVAMFGPLFNGGQPAILVYSEFLPVTYVPASKTFFSLGGGLKAFVPKWNFSPFVGLGGSFVNAQGAPFGLPDNSFQLHINGGFSWQLERGILGEAGMAYCPTVSGICGFFVSSGYFF